MKNTALFERELPNADLERLFNPRAITIIGVGKSPYGGGFFLRSLVEAGFPHPLYPVNPRLAGGEVFGHKVYGAVAEIPGDPPVDLAIVAVPAATTPKLMGELGEAGIPFAHVFSSGYSEVGKVGLEQELLEAARRAGVRVVGPNCMGVYNPRARIFFADGLTSESGNVGYVSQSGGLAARLALNGPTRGYYFSKAVSVGNQVDLDVLDFLRYFADDPETGIIAAYLENLKRDGHLLVPLMKQTTLEKPVVIWKSGKSQRGQKAVVSHTGGLAGNYELWKAMAKQTGVTLVDSFDELTEMVQAFSILPVPETRGTAIITAGGGLSVEGTDLCEANGLTVPALSTRAQERLAAIFSDVNTNLQNPLDLGAMGLMADTFAKAMEVLADEPQISNIIFVKDPERFPVYAQNFGIENFTEVVVKSIGDAKPPGKVVVGASTILREVEDAVVARFRFQEALLEKGIPSFNTIESAIKCIRRLWEYGEYRRKHGGEKK
ncbi:MAG: CoA-binding protein [Promethearchaeota archaeon]